MSGEHTRRCFLSSHFPFLQKKLVFGKFIFSCWASNDDDFLFQKSPSDFSALSYELFVDQTKEQFFFLTKIDTIYDMLDCLFYLLL